ncbi:hypothetical protein F4821DRAFT_274029 [Hypoxylon rubiginosum]|uniref:Uncharacterized protein n=1 Tax=Hypoxylon rubiginosum TaxID=110542 RepID=A0ACC0CI93_9PEZI|nr:hypothetical protein F4821DRAFT_274029 [Hypoxylon rubiginosum]
MRRFDDRFARQNRCEPPPEFPLASPYPRIVHHLSGPNSYALTQIHPKTSGSGLIPKHSHKCSTPWSVFQDGSLITITPASLPKRGPRSPGEPHSPCFCPPPETDAGLNPVKCTGENTG